MLQRGDSKLSYTLERRMGTDDSLEGQPVASTVCCLSKSRFSNITFGWMM